MFVKVELLWFRLKMSKFPSAKTREIPPATVAASLAFWDRITSTHNRVLVLLMSLPLLLFYIGLGLQCSYKHSERHMLAFFMLVFKKWPGCYLSLSVWLHACLSGLQAEISQIVRENAGVTVRGVDKTNNCICFSRATNVQLSSVD